jgi:hypothetical protein
MNEEKHRDWIDWIDVISKLLIPVVIAAVGILYSSHQGGIERMRLDAQRQDESDRRDLERDTGYIKMLASSNENEQELGMGIIGVLSREHKFSKDLIAVLTIFAGGPQADSLTLAANRILAKAGAQDQLIGAQIASAAANSPIQVYVQIAKEEQREDGLKLQLALRNKGFATPPIRLVNGAVATVHTYVRFFSAPGALKASIVNDVMRELGYTSAVQDFSAFTQTPLPSIEVWIGKSQGRLLTGQGK